MSPCPSHSSSNPRSSTCKAALSSRAWSRFSGCAVRFCNDAGRCNSSVVRGFFCGGCPVAFAEAPGAPTCDVRQPQRRSSRCGKKVTVPLEPSKEGRPQDSHRASLCQVLVCCCFHVSHLNNNMTRTVHTTCVHE